MIRGSPADTQAWQSFVLDDLFEFVFDFGEDVVA